ncbi:hypothetical protein V7S43_007304 [Phytophthora oleae]|uniref:HTH myb-type domain-containing protein n=1 Tax=Phytophthora oleae TaxID=2107226 RepID=A0ABD3FPY0_9STRA
MDKSSGGTTDQAATPKLIRLPLTRPFGTRNKKNKAKLQSTSGQTLSSLDIEAHNKPQRHGQGWTTEEHDRFLQALEIFPSGPWKDVAAFIGTRTPRQVMTHAQNTAKRFVGDVEDCFKPFSVQKSIVNWLSRQVSVET